MVVGMIPRVFAFRTQGMQRLRWAAQADNGPVGEPVFRLRRTTKAVFDDFRQWVADDPSEVACDEVITHARVKAILDTLHSDQLHRGDRNGLLHKKGPGNHDLWDFTDVDPSRPVGSDGADDQGASDCFRRGTLCILTCVVLGSRVCICANCRFPSCKCAAYVGHSLT